MTFGGIEPGEQVARPFCQAYTCPVSWVTAREIVQLSVVRELADMLMLGPLLERLRERYGHYQLLDHWTQGEFHHDLVLQIDGLLSVVSEGPVVSERPTLSQRTGSQRPAGGSQRPGLPGPVLVVATNCNGGVKEVLCFATPPSRSALWSHRCPDNPEFEGELPQLLDHAVTSHWFDPCELLAPDARSELRVECRQRQPGGGWVKKDDRG